MIRQLFASAALAVVAACATDTGETTPAASAAAPTAALDAVLAAQPAADQARYKWRHPKETLEFFGVAPGMTVVDTLPGKVWWSGILAAYLGPEGRVIGADYSPEMWKLFGDYAPPPEEKAKWADEWVASASEWAPEGGAKVGAIFYGAVPADLKGGVDVVLVSRAMHHFNRLEDDGGWRTAALKDMMDLLKPGGIVGVEQHRAPEANPDAWADGENGYLKQSQMIAAFEAAGFEFVGSSEVNANPADRPTAKDFVWRLPPTFATAENNPALKAEMEAIGESDRMTLKFRKPL